MLPKLILTYIIAVSTNGFSLAKETKDLQELEPTFHHEIEDYNVINKIPIESVFSNDKIHLPLLSESNAFNDKETKSDTYDSVKQQRTFHHPRSYSDSALKKFKSDIIKQLFIERLRGSDKKFKQKVQKLLMIKLIMDKREEIFRKFSAREF